MTEEKHTTKKRGSIQTKIIILTIFATAISLLFSNIISSSISTKNGKVSVMNSLGDKTTSISLLVTEYINKAYTLTESLAYSGDLRKSEPQTQAAVLSKTVQNNPFFILFYQQKMDGEQTARSSGELSNRADRWWFKQITADKKPFVTKSYPDTNTGFAVSSIIYPVYTWGNERCAGRRSKPSKTTGNYRTV